MAAKKRVDPIKQREKRAKILLAVCGVLFLGLAAIQGPKMLKMLHPKPVVPPPTNLANPDGTVSGGAVAPTQTTLSGVTGAGQLADTDVPPAGDGGQLVSFELFDTKNPFTPQVKPSPAGGSSSAPTSTTPTQTGATSTAPTTTTPAPTATATTTAPEAPVTAVPSTAPTTTPTTVRVRPTVSISVNGAVSKVSTGGTFPSRAPVFRLVSWRNGSAEVAIVGGSYATGDPTLTLTQGKPVTLQNTTDGTRYSLVLLSTP